MTDNKTNRQPADDDNSLFNIDPEGNTTTDGADDDNINPNTPDPEASYDKDAIRTLNWKEHLRLRPTMYIGGLGDGTKSDDGIYILLKEVVDNSIDEYMQGYGRQIDIEVDEHTVSVRDYGRGIPLEAVVDASSKINTGAKYDSKVFKKSVGLNGVGIKAVNALSTEFVIECYREGKMKRVEFSRAEIVNEYPITDTDQPNGTYVRFTPDATLFRGYAYLMEYVVPLVKNYAYLNTGLAIVLNGKRYISRRGLLDLLQDVMTKEPLYPIIHLKGEDIEVAITHASQYGEEYYSFVNGQHTTQGGTHLTAFKDVVGRTIKEHFRKSFEPSDVRNGMVAAIAIKAQEPMFESQTKIKFTSRDVGPEGPTVAKFVGDFIKTSLDNYLHRNGETAEAMLKKILDSERERKAMAATTKAVKERTKKISIHNKKLFDCSVHLNDTRGDKEAKLETCIFITEGDSAAGAITKIRDVKTQAVFSLRGKPLNTYGLTPVKIATNEEFSLLQAALNIDEGIEGLRYNKVIIATDADVDGMHIRLLLLTYFLQFFPDLIKKGHVYVLQTPLFRVRNEKTSRRKGKQGDKAADEIFYCYNDDERVAAIKHFGKDAEITRFKGLGEISPEEFRGFIGPDMRLDRVTLRKEDRVGQLLEFYMGKNTPDRQNFIIDNLVVEDDSDLDDTEVPQA